MISINKDGQPLFPIGFCYDNNRIKAWEQLCYIAKGIMIDDVVTDLEIERFCDKLRFHAVVHDHKLFTCLLSRFEVILSDGFIDEEERHEIMAILSGIAGDNDNLIPEKTMPKEFLEKESVSQITYRSKEFMITGRFAFGTRAKVKSEITLRGGIICENNRIKISTDYLLVGTFASRDWIEASYGRKIETAQELQKQGHKIEIIYEDDWLKTLDDQKLVND